MLFRDLQEANNTIAVLRGSGLPIDAVRSELTPEQKITVVLSERKYGPVMMVGDGVNDAPALAAAFRGLQWARKVQPLRARLRMLSC
jgi:cation transport ATPase